MKSGLWPVEPLPEGAADSLRECASAADGKAGAAAPAAASSERSTGSTALAPEANPEPVTGPYVSHAEHLRDELARIDQLIRAQTVRWRLTVAASKPESLWGMAHVSDAEIDRYLSSGFASPRELPPEIERRMRPYWQAAEGWHTAIRARRAETSSEAELRLEHLARCFELSDLEQDILLICLLPEIDERYRRLFGYLQDDASRRLPTVELVLQILHPVLDASGGRSAFDASAPLLTHRLLVMDPSPSGAGFSMRSVGVEAGIAAYLGGRDGIDARVQVWLDPRRVDLGIPPPLERSQLLRLEAIAESWLLGQSTRGAFVLLQGQYGSGRLEAASWISQQAEKPLLAIDVRRARRSQLGWGEVVATCLREATLRGATICWTACETLLEQPDSTALWTQLIAACERWGGLCLLSSSSPWEPSGTGLAPRLLRFDLTMPSYAQRCRLWQQQLTSVVGLAENTADPASLASALANSFQLNHGQISDAIAGAASHALRRDPENAEVSVEDLYEACRRQSTHRLKSFARRIEPPPDRGFEDLVLPAPNRRQMEELLHRIRYRGQVLNGLGFERRLSLGKGLIVLFTGSSGTGKSMAAELLAREQGVDLYKVDMSSVVSKYVGETEKNLAGVFDQAEDANAVLFFDEADALFGQRGEVKDARDRWANMEVNYLLQRVEEYSGVVILTSNLRQNIDMAFMRRLQVIVEFPFPDADLRFLIWCKTFPDGLGRPADDELRELAERFRFSGGEIKNIVVDAAFRALAEVGDSAPEITRRHLLLAIAREYQKTGKPLTAKDFGAEDLEWVSREIL
ncbi:MAG: ATP-binding protein [Acidobacteriota bacterium]